eukprot:2343417-Rhodomonas_salina.2
MPDARISKPQARAVCSYSCDVLIRVSSDLLRAEYHSWFSVASSSGLGCFHVILYHSFIGKLPPGPEPTKVGL